MDDLKVLVQRMTSRVSELEEREGILRKAPKTPKTKKVEKDGSLVYTLDEIAMGKVSGVKAFRERTGVGLAHCVKIWNETVEAANWFDLFNKLASLKEYRRLTGCDLRTAIDAYDRVKQSLGL
jgi:hypothetical protein